MQLKRVMGFTLAAVGLGSCGSITPLDIGRALFGYREPPKAESVMETLKIEYQRCMDDDPNRNCIQLAYDVTRERQGLDPRPIPKGYVTITQEYVEEESGQQKDSDEQSNEDSQR